MKRILDLYCGAGGCSEGYFRAGFEVVGVDLQPQPHYPFEFHQADACEFVAAHGLEFDAVHASPPCQEYSRTNRIVSGEYPNLIDKTRRCLQKHTHGVYVIENVPGAPLRKPILLCGVMFGLLVTRHRLFETSLPLVAPAHPPHTRPMVKLGRAPNKGDYINPAGNFIGAEYARQAMDIDWMTRDELAQAIPPAYTEYIGRQFLALLGD